MNEVARFTAITLFRLSYLFCLASKLCYELGDKAAAKVAMLEVR